MRETGHARRSSPGGAKPVAVWPSATELPANILRFYVEFDGPAEASFDRSTLKLLDDAGREVVSPFLVFAQELWSLDGRQLTVLLDPARIKRGLGNGSAHDPAIREGQSYSLVVDGTHGLLWTTFHAAAPVYSALDETTWAVEVPGPGGFSPLQISFDRVMDVALCSEEIVVVSSDGEPVSGVVRLSKDGRHASFFPALTWTRGAYYVAFSARLEDVCGNRLGEPLDHPVGESVSPRSGVVHFAT